MVVVIIHTAKSPKMHLAEIFLLSSKCWQSLIIKIVVVAIVCQNIPWRCRAAASGLRDDLEPDESRGLRSRTRSSRGKVGRKRENMHNAIIIVDNALSIAREMTSMTSTTESRGNWRNWLSFEKSRSFFSAIDKKVAVALEMANAETYGGIVSVRREKKHTNAHFSPVSKRLFRCYRQIEKKKKRGSRKERKKKVEINPMRYNAFWQL